MATEITLVAYPVKDLAKAKAFYGAYLGVEPYVDSPYYVGYRIGEQEVGLDPHGRAAGPIGYRTVPDIEQAVAALVAAGGQVVQAPKDVARGLQIAQVQDADGNIVGFRQFSA